MHIFKTSLLFSALVVLLSACGGGGGGSDSGTGGSTGGGGTGGGGSTGGGTTIINPPNINYIEADAMAAYTANKQLAFLTRNNAADFVDLLFDRNGQSSPVNPYPYDLKGNPSGAETQANQVQDFLYAQEEILRRTEQVLFPEKTLERLIGFQEEELCDNGGAIYTLGERDDVTNKSKVRMRYDNCEVNGYLMNGDAYTFLYEYSTTYDRPKSILLSYDKMDISSFDNAYQVTGTVHKVADFATGTDRYITELFRWNAAAQKQSLLDILRYDFGDGLGQMIGDDNTYTGIYDGFHGRARVETMAELNYANGGNTPTSGEIRLTGQGGSRLYITAQSDQTLIINVDADGDGFYEEQLSY